MLSIVKYFKNIFHSYFLLQKVADLIFVQFLLQHRPNKVNSHMYSLNIFWFIYWFLFVFVGLKMWLRTVGWNHRYNLAYIAAKKKNPVTSQLLDFYSDFCFLWQLCVLWHTLLPPTGSIFHWKSPSLLSRIFAVKRKKRKKI